MNDNMFWKHLCRILPAIMLATISAYYTTTYKHIYAEYYH